MKVLFKFVCLLVVILLSTQAFAYTVQPGDTLIGIADKLGVDYREICKLNQLANCNKIRAGQELKIPSMAPLELQSPEPKRETAPTSIETDIADAKSESTPSQVNAIASGLTRNWKCVGCDPVLKSWVHRKWLSTEEVRLDSRQEARLRLQGLDDSQIGEVKQLLKEKQYTLVFRPNGYTWNSMAFGSGVWGRTRNATGDDIPVFALPPTSKGYQVDLALGCGNPAVNTVEPSKPKPEPLPPQEQEKKVSCERIGFFWAQLSENGASGAARFACLFQVNKDWKAGPTVGFGASRFDDHTWVEVQNFAGGGFEVRGKNIAGFDAVEFVVMVGYGSSEGHSADGLVDKLKSSGWDAQLAAQLREQFRIDSKTAVTVRFMPFANIPLTGVEADILWKNMVVKQENGRHLTIGAVMRFEFQREGLGFKPEITFGIWRMSDVDNPIGWKFLLGASTLDNVWRIGAGLQFPGPIWLVEIEYNPAWGWLQLNAETAKDALHKGATPTCEALKMKECSNWKPVVVETENPKPEPALTAKVLVEQTNTVQQEERRGWKDSTHFMVVPVKGKAEISTPPQQAEPTFGFNDR